MWKRGTKLESLALESDWRSESLPSSESKRSVSVRTKKIEGKRNSIVGERMKCCTFGRVGEGEGEADESW